MSIGALHNSLRATSPHKASAVFLPVLRIALSAKRRVFFFVGFVSSVFLFCSPPPPLTKDIASALPSVVAPDDGICSFKGYGDIGFSMNGQRHKTKIDVLWRSDSDFTVGLYSPLGSTIASVRGDSSGLIRIIAGDSVYQKRLSESVAIGDFLSYSLSFKEFLRVATGRLLDASFASDRSDSLLLSAKKVFLYWPEDSTKGRNFQISATIDRKHFLLTDVIYSKKEPSSWELTQLSFRKGRAKEIHFKDKNNNYFYVKYETMIIKHGNKCESERL
jgi:hypothetical protein